MSKTIINFKVDSDVKAAAQAVAKELGVPLSTIVNAQLRELIRTRTLSVSSTPHMTPALERILATVEKDRSVGRNVTTTHSLTDALAHLAKL